MDKHNNTYQSHFDSVVMLTWSNWHTEPRSNRYHYATRFAKHLPVIFVQPDLPNYGYEIENVDDHKNIKILHISRIYGAKQTSSLIEAFSKLGLRMPLLWIYNVQFYDFLTKFYSPFRIYHATEDYFDNSTYHGRQYDILRILLIHVLQRVDLVISVSSGVLENFIKNSNYSGRSLVLRNGCDIQLWGDPPLEFEMPTDGTYPPQVIFYQGSINNRLDFRLILYLVKKFHDWEFWFAGPQLDTSVQDEWDIIVAHPNVKYLGNLDPVDVKDLAYSAAVGIIPFERTEYLVQRSLPLKSFEYVAAGLPVVSITINELENYDDIFFFGDTYEEFSYAIEAAAQVRYDYELISKRKIVSSLQDYDLRFSEILPQIERQFLEKIEAEPEINVAFIHSDNNSTHQFLNAISEFPNFRTRFINLPRTWWENLLWRFRGSFGLFDVIIIHESLVTDREQLDTLLQMKLERVPALRVCILLRDSLVDVSKVMHKLPNHIMVQDHILDEVASNDFRELIFTIMKTYSEAYHYPTYSAYLADKYDLGKALLDLRRIIVYLFDIGRALLRLVSKFIKF